MVEQEGTPMIRFKIITLFSMTNWTKLVNIYIRTKCFSFCWDFN